MNPLCGIPVSAQLGWVFAPGREQICSVPWVGTHSVEGTPGNHGMSVTPFFYKFLRETQRKTQKGVSRPQCHLGQAILLPFASVSPSMFAVKPIIERSTTSPQNQAPNSLKPMFRVNHKPQGTGNPPPTCRAKPR